MYKPYCRKCGSRKVELNTGKMNCKSCKETFTWEIRPFPYTVCGICGKEITVDLGGWNQDSNNSWRSDPYLARTETFQLCKECKEGFKRIFSKK